MNSCLAKYILFLVITFGGLNFNDLQAQEIQIESYCERSKFTGKVIFKAMKNRKYGFTDSAKNVILPFVYDEASCFSEGFTRVKQNSIWWIINEKGETIYQLNYSGFGDFHEGYAAVRKNHRSGFINKKGEQITKLKYTKVGDFKNGRALVSKDKLKLYYDRDTTLHFYNILQKISNLSLEFEPRWGYINTDGKEIIKPKYDEVFNPNPIIYYNNHNDCEKGMIILRKGKHWGCIDSLGKLIVPFKYDYVELNDSFLEVRKNNKLGLYNLKGRRISKVKYLEFGYYRQAGLIYRYGEKDKQRTTGIITKKGKVVQKDLNYPIYSSKPGRYAVMKSGKRWFIYRNDSLIKFKPNFDTVIKPQFYSRGLRMTNGGIGKDNAFHWKNKNPKKKISKLKKVTFFKSSEYGILIAQKNNRYGIMDSSGRIITGYQFDEIEEFYFDIAKVKKDGKYGLLDSKGNLIGDIKYDKIISNRNHGWRTYENYSYYFENGIAKVKTIDGWGFLNSLGKEICPPIFDSVKQFRNGLILLMKNGKWGIINKEGDEILPVDYDSITALSYYDYNHSDYHPSLIMKNGKWGAIDNKGKVIVPISFDAITSFYDNGFAFVMNKGKRGIIDKSGTLIIPASFDLVTRFYENGLAKVMNNKKWGVIDNKGQQVLPVIYDDISFINCYHSNKPHIEKVVFEVRKKQEYVTIDGTGKEIKLPIEDYHCYR